MQDRSSEARGRSRVVILLTFIALCSLLVVAFAVPAFASWTPATEQGATPDRGCRDATGAETSPDHCDDPCDDAAAARGGGDDRCEEKCEDLLSAAWGGGGGHDDDDCPLPCPTLPPAPTVTPTETVPPAPTKTPTGTLPPAPTGTPEATPTDTVPEPPTATPPPVPTAAAAHGGGGDDRRGEVRFDCDTEDEYGRIVSLPVETEDAAVEAAHSGRGGLRRDQFNGEWVIGDKTFTVSAETLLVADHGRFEVGKCVEVTWGVDNPSFALMIESKRDFKCGPDTTQPAIWGAVWVIPDDPSQLGVWTVGGIDFVVTAETQIVPNRWSNDDIEVGDFVLVKFTDVDGTLIATSIQSIWPHKHGYGWWSWRMGRAFGPIETFPAGGGVGVWEIAGVPYVVTDKTKLDDDSGAFAVGVNVKVEFYKMADGSRIARKIESTHDTGGGNGQTFRFVGVVDAKPTAFVGDWTIGGAAFVADANTTFNERKGLLVEGAYVAVRYSITDDVRLISEIKTVVPPGGGGHKHFGRIQRHGSSTMAVAAADGVAENVWTIGDQNFVVTEGTLLNDQLSALEDGQLALVDAYAEDDGTLVATSIEGMGQNFLPMMQNR